MRAPFDWTAGCSGGLAHPLGYDLDREVYCDSDCRNKWMSIVIHNSSGGALLASADD